MSDRHTYGGEVFILRGECDRCKVPVEWCGSLTPAQPQAKCAECGSPLAWLTEEDDE